MTAAFSDPLSPLGSFGIAIVAPSGYARDEAGIARGLARLATRGCRVHNYYDPERVFQRFGATDDVRLAQLYAAAANPDVEVVMALRGQYGLTRLLPQIDFARLAASGKIFCGFSDFTALQMGLYMAGGRQSYSGPMFYPDFAPQDVDAFTLGDFARCLAGLEHRVCGHAPGNPAIDAQGIVWGGNLAMLMSLLGTDYFPRIDGGILYLEDINEHPYRIERMLLQLLQAGVLGRQQALVLGDFSAYKLSAADNGYDFDAMLDYLRKTLPLPVLCGLPFGHGRTRVTIPFGAPGHLRAEGGAFELTLRDYPTLSQPVPVRAA